MKKLNNVFRIIILCCLKHQNQQEWKKEIKSKYIDWQKLNQLFKKMNEKQM